MRHPRVLGNTRNEANFYHCVTRAIEGRFIFEGSAEKEKMRQLIFAHARMTGLRVLTYCIMSNHVHLLLEVPHRDPEALAAMSEGELLQRLGAVYSAESLGEIAAELERTRAITEEYYREYRSKFEARMLDLSVYMREVKQRFYHRRAVLCS